MEKTEYNLITGEIKAQIYKSDGQPYTVSSGAGVVDGLYNAALYYFDVQLGEMVLLSDFALNITSSIGIIDISNIPAGARCKIFLMTERINDAVVDDGVVEFTTDYTGTYSFTFMHPRYITTSFEVTV